MRRFRLVPILLTALLIAGVVPARAQEDNNPCQIDMTDIIDLASVSQQQADAGDLASALETLALIQTQVNALVLACTTTNIPDFASIDLPQTITVEDPNMGGTLTLSYPADWFAEAEVNYIRLGNRDSALRAASVVDLAPGEVQINTGVYSAPLLAMLGIDAADSPEDFILAQMEFANASAPALHFEIEDIVTFDADGRDAAIGIGTAAYAGIIYPNRIAIVDVGDYFVSISMFAGEGTDLTEHEALLLAIAASVEYEGDS